MARVFVGTGSNENREENIRSGISALRELFGELTISTVYRNEAIGFDGDDFYNFVVAFDTDMDVTAIYHALRKIEDAHGRDRSQPKFSPRTLDLDLLLYDDLVIENDMYQLPRDDILKYAFVLKPLAEIAPAIKHPVLERSYDELWQEFDQTGQHMQAVQLDLN